MYTLVANCEEEVQRLIEGCNTPVEVSVTLQSHYKRWTRTHMSAFLLNINKLLFENQIGISIAKHIIIFENNWNLLQLNTMITTTNYKSLEAEIKNFTTNDRWKATILYISFPKVQTYQNIIDNITESTEIPSHAKVVLHLKEYMKHTSKL